MVVFLTINKSLNVNKLTHQLVEIDSCLSAKANK